MRDPTARRRLRPVSEVVVNRFEGIASPSLISAGGLLALGSAAQVLQGLIKPSDAAQTALFEISSLALLIGALTLVQALVVLYVRRAQQVGSFGLSAALVAGTGTILLCAVFWSQSFLFPTAAVVAPELLDDSKPVSLLFGFLITHAIFGVGWAMVGVALIRARVYGFAPAIGLILGGILSVVPFLTLGQMVLGLGLAWLGLSPAYVRSGRYRHAEAEPAGA